MEVLLAPAVGGRSIRDSVWDVLTTAGDMQRLLRRMGLSSLPGPHPPPSAGQEVLSRAGHSDERQLLAVVLGTAGSRCHCASSFGFQLTPSSVWSARPSASARAGSPPSFVITGAFSGMHLSRDIPVFCSGGCDFAIGGSGTASGQLSIHAEPMGVWGYPEP